MLKFIWPGANIYVYIYLYIYTTVSIEIHCSTMPQDVTFECLPNISLWENERREERGGGWALYRETQTARESELLQKDRFNNRRIKQELWFCLWLTYKHIPHIKLSHMNAINIYQSVNRHRFSSSIVSAVLPVILKSLLNCSMHLWFN